MNVTATCREVGVSRKTFYKYLARFTADGVDGFFPRSRRSVSNPAATPAGVADAIVRARKELEEEGGDYGAISIGWRLQDEGVAWVPSRATIHRVLVRRGQVAPAPRKRPRAANYRRFEAPRPNAMWQLDGFVHRLAGGREVTVLQLIDDHSRLALATRAAPSENGRDAWEVFATADARHGLPRVLLTDNGPAFNGHRRGFTTALELRLRALGVTPVSSAAGHPQTCGKDERAHATLQRWLTKQEPAEDLDQLQAQLNTYEGWFNNRRHQGIGSPPNSAGTSPTRSTPAASRCRPRPRSPGAPSAPAAESASTDTKSGSAGVTAAPKPPSSAPATSSPCSSAQNTSAASSSTATAAISPATTNPHHPHGT